MIRIGLNKYFIGFTVLGVNLFFNHVSYSDSTENIEKTSKENVNKTLKHSVDKAPKPIDEAFIVSEKAVNDLNRQREEIEKTKKELLSQEAELKAREKALNEEIQKLDEARKSISKMVDTKKKEDEEKISKLVETFLTMSPKSASKVLSSLDDELAVAVMSRMDTPKLAKILNLMEIGRSSKLSELYVGINRRTPEQVVSTANTGGNPNLGTAPGMGEKK